ncbi:UDP-N-acetylmuramate--alanine ligase [hydrothermal vent metagenome]|uniref:UDP-N-acetylmuramate--L-alanine ligase n=1 Tax=hydrothermal vent metagenome TaxID=652676 RepID=A0A1W1BPV6_9ZZZZ
MRIQNIHFVGIGGSGMGGIAEIMHNLNYKITGSDITKNTTTNKLEKIGVKVFNKHHPDNIKNAQAIVVSSAITNDNVELIAARQNRIPIVPRSQMLAEIMRFRYGIAISGTHGKTTTTSLIAHILTEANLDPTFIIGGVLNATGNNAQLGSSRYLIAEADESDGSFLNLQPMLSVITNIDNDHMGTYQNDTKKLEDSFLQFISNLPFYGLCVLCSDDKGVERILSRVSRSFICYGLSNNADIQAINIQQTQSQMIFDVNDHIRNKLFSITLNLIGNHNILNALAAITIALELKIDIKNIQLALESFSGVGRRLESYGSVILNDKKFLLFDDYAHHPNEIKATLEGVKASYPKYRLVVIFQAHRYSRTKDLFDDFVNILSKIDVLLLLDIYPANEEPIENISATTLANSIRQRQQTIPIVTDLNNVIDVLKNIIKDDDIVITMGAGSINTLAKNIKNVAN